MSAPDLTAQMMQQVRDSGAEAHSTILLGAGASTTSGLPDWDTFAIRLLIQSGSVDNLKSAELLLSRQDPLMVVEAARMALGDKWDQHLRAALYEGVTSLDPSPLHLAAISHFLAGNYVDSSLVTLNFDVLLELAIQEETRQLPRSISDNSADPGENVVHHLHGVISPQLTQNVVLTLTDFNELIANNDSWQFRYLQSAITRGALIIAGTSYRDPDLRQWLHKALKDKPAEHSAVVLLAREAFSVSKSDFFQIQQAVSDQWRAVGIQPLLLQDHSDAAQIIRELRHVHAENYQSPQQRSLQVWKSHARQFDELQPRYAQQLWDDAEVLKEVLNTDRLSLSLWIADGRGQLVRWAAQDRTYHDVSLLRSVETGHDSPWIAGQALGADALLFKDLENNAAVRWKSVLSFPVQITTPQFPAHPSAVLTIGLPEQAAHYVASQLLWGDPLVRIADNWGTQLAAIAFEDQPSYT